MPNYDYICPNCNFTINMFHKMSEKPEVCCLSCTSKKEMVKKIGPGISFQLKGSGFYQNDYAKI